MKWARLIACILGAGRSRLPAGELSRTGILRAPVSRPAECRTVPSTFSGNRRSGTRSLLALLYGTRVSLLLAPAAALLSSLLAGLIGGRRICRRLERSCVHGGDGPVLVASLALPTDHGAGYIAAERCSPDLGGDHVCAAGMPGLGRRGARHLRRRARFPAVRLCCLARASGK